MVNSGGDVSWIQARATKCSGRRPGPQITAPAVLARAPFRQRCAVTRVSMKRRPSNRGANLSSAAAAAPLRRLLPAASSSLAGGDPCCTCGHMMRCERPEESHRDRRGNSRRARAYRGGGVCGGRGGGGRGGHGGSGGAPPHLVRPEGGRRRTMRTRGRARRRWDPTEQWAAGYRSPGRGGCGHIYAPSSGSEP